MLYVSLGIHYADHPSLLFVLGNDCCEWRKEGVEVEWTLCHAAAPMLLEEGGRQ